MKCPNCNGESTGRFCPYCGSEMPKKEASIHIEHNETIINNYNQEIERDYDSIYKEERMREKAREDIARKRDYEEKQRQNQIFLVKLCIGALFILLAWWKVSSWWDGLFDDGVKPIKTNSEEYNAVITIDDNDYFADNASEFDEDKWYRITCSVESNFDSSIDSLKYGINSKYFYANMEEGIELQEMKKGTEITFVGYLRTVGNGRLYFSHCIIE